MCISDSSCLFLTTMIHFNINLHGALHGTFPDWCFLKNIFYPNLPKTYPRLTQDFQGSDKIASVAG